MPSEPRPAGTVGPTGAMAHPGLHKVSPMLIIRQPTSTTSCPPRIVSMDSHSQAPSHPSASPTYSRKNPFLADLIGHERLTGSGSSKDTRHFVLNLKGSGIVYTPGDSLGAFGRNPPDLVDELLAWLEFAGDTPVTGPAGQSTTFRQA